MIIKNNKYQHMKTKILWLLILISGKIIAQVGINTHLPSATLDIVSKGNTNATKALEVNNSSATEIFTILDNGNIGIGINNPSQRLDIAGNVSVLPQGGAASSLNFYENSANGTNFISVKAPANFTTNRTFTLPQNAPASGFVLTTDAFGVTSWGAVNPSASTLASISLTNQALGATVIANNGNSGGTADQRFFQAFNNTVTDPNGRFNISTGTYTASQAGNYLITAYIVPNAAPYNNTSNNYYPVNLEVRKNCTPGNPNSGTIIMDNSAIRYGTPGNNTFRYSVVVNGMATLSAGDTINLVIYLFGPNVTGTNSGISFPEIFTYAAIAEFKAFFSVTAL